MSFLVTQPIYVKAGSDFLFTNHGSICLLEPLSVEGEQWMGDNLPVDSPETQFWGRAIVIEPRYVEDILVGIAGDGLLVSRHRDVLN